MCVWIFVISDWRDQWSEVVHSVDASFTRAWVSKSRWDIVAVRDVGRATDRSRYRLGAQNIRDRALSSAGFVLKSVGKLATDKHDQHLRVHAELVDEVDAQREGTRIKFSRSASTSSRQENWHNVMPDTWRFPANILILDARVLVKTAERVGCSQAISNWHVVLLCDSLGVILAFSRRHAREFPLLIPIRRIVAIGLMRGVGLLGGLRANLITRMKGAGWRVIRNPNRSQPV